VKEGSLLKEDDEEKWDAWEILAEIYLRKTVLKSDAKPELRSPECRNFETRESQGCLSWFIFGKEA
jgi:hypothetical protein